MWIRYALLLLLTICAGCAASPAMEFAGAAPRRVTAGGRDYQIWQVDNRFEIVRLGWAPRGSHQAIRADMLALVEQVTGCALIASSVTGDSGEMRGSLRC